jgi:4-hydroxy-3-methylbut-2-enyl diphosphate reductase IspH
VIFSAHGVPKAVPLAASARKLFQIDATCPLVTKVHMEAQRHHAEGLEIVLIGHRHHPEVIGTMGQLPEGAITLVETVADVEALTVKDPGSWLTSRKQPFRLMTPATLLFRCNGAFRIRGTVARRYLLCHHEPAGSGEIDFKQN